MPAVLLNIWVVSNLWEVSERIAFSSIQLLSGVKLLGKQRMDQRNFYLCLRIPVKFHNPPTWQRLLANVHSLAGKGAAAGQSQPDANEPGGPALCRK